MKLRILTFSIALSGVFIFTSCNQSSNKDVSLTTRADSVSYSYGLMLATDFANNGLDSVFNPEIIATAMNDQFAENGKLKPEEAQMVLQMYFTEKQRIDDEKRMKANKQFLLENKTKEGVITLPSGLQYQVMIEGKGPKPALTDKVTAHYHGTLIDGTIFDSSVQRGQPADFAVQGVIPGWTEALQLMPVGSKWKLFVPHNLGYGMRGTRGIPPYSTLIFEIELIAIAK